MNSGPKTSHIAIVSLAALLPLLPFLDKAFHIDDTLFIWTARQILENPLDFYGFAGNWWSYESPATTFIKNPPLTSYYIAFIALFTGFSERALHIAFLVPALFAALGTYMLALRFTRLPVAAALAAVATPAFIVSSTNVMCDVMLLAFWNWAMVFWIRGLERDRGIDLAIGGVLIAAAALTKYFGVSLIPLLAVFSMLQGKKGFKALAYLLIPVAALAGYQIYTQHMYGRGLLLDAAEYASGVTGGSREIGAEKAFTGVVFTGGSVIIALFLFPSVFGLRAVAAGAALAAFGAVYVYGKGTIGGTTLFEPGFGWAYIAQLALYWAAGAGILLLAASDLAKRKDAVSVLLFLWVAGTFAFAVFFNWTINARSILPMVPAVAILLMRAAEGRSPLRAYLPIVPALAVSLLVAWGDYGFANSARTAAKSISDKYYGMGGKLWFQGHWGFQYYMEKGGALPINNRISMIDSGSLVVIPLNNTGLTAFPDGLAKTYLDGYNFPSTYAATMPPVAGAGFYSNIWGPVPFMFFHPKGESYMVFYINEDWSVPESFLSPH